MGYVYYLIDWNEGLRYFIQINQEFYIIPQLVKFMSRKVSSRWDPMADFENSMERRDKVVEHNHVILVLYVIDMNIVVHIYINEWLSLS